MAAMFERGRASREIGSFTAQKEPEGITVGRAVPCSSEDDVPREGSGLS